LSSVVVAMISVPPGAFLDGGALDAVVAHFFQEVGITDVVCPLAMRAGCQTA
jgi:hypothetical protein